MATDLLLLTPGFPADEGDSTCIPPLQAFLLALRRARPDLRIAVIALQYPYTLLAYSWHGISVFPCNGRIRWYLKLRTWRRASQAFSSILATGPVRCIHSLWLGEAALLGSRFARRTGARHLLTLMGQDARDGARWWRRIAQRPITVCLSRKQASAFQVSTGQAVEVIIPWGFSLAEKATPLGYDQRDTDLLFCGSLITVKRPEIFVQVISAIVAERRIKAMIIGDGPQRAMLEREVRQGGLGETVIFTGTLSHDEVLDRMSRSRILIHPSSYEGYGQVFAEALASGMSVVSFDVGRATPSAHWHVVGDVKAMIGATRDLLHHPPSTGPLILDPIASTVDAYQRLYGLI